MWIWDPDVPYATDWPGWFVAFRLRRDAELLAHIDALNLGELTEEAYRAWELEADERYTGLDPVREYIARRRAAESRPGPARDWALRHRPPRRVQ